MADDDRASGRAIGIDVPTDRGGARDHRGRHRRNRARFMTAVFTGLRASELRALYWNDLELRARASCASASAPTGGAPSASRRAGTATAKIPLIPRLSTRCGVAARLSAPPDGARPGLSWPGRRRSLITRSLQLAFDEVQRAGRVRRRRRQAEVRAARAAPLLRVLGHRAGAPARSGYSS